MRVLLYNVQKRGIHKPLTREQITELFHDGHLHRNDKCKPAAKSDWQTIDELFPLLKYDGTYLHVSALQEKRPGIVWSERFLLAFAAIVVVGLSIFLCERFINRNRATAPLVTHHSYSPEPARRHPSPASTTSSVTSFTEPTRVTTPISIKPAFTAGVADPAAAARAGSDEQRSQREQLQREQAANADRLRQENRAREEALARAKGTDHIIPLDTYCSVPIGASSISVKIHDNDVTSIDVWINGSWRHELKKEKGISGSGTDETLIYTSGRSRVYYVWELSGELNHCLLRVHEN